MTDISSLGTYKNSLNNMVNSMGNLQNSQKKVSSGKEFETYQDMATANQLDVVESLRNELFLTEKFIQSDEYLEKEIRNTAEKIDLLQDLARDYASLLAKRNGPSGHVLDFENGTKNILKNVETILNSTFGNKHIFGGNITGTKPVKDIVNISNIIDDQDSKNYYQGSSSKLSIDISQDTRLEYGILASDDPIQKFIASMHIGMKASKNNDVVGLSESIDKINEATSGLAKLTLNIGTQLDKLEKTKEVLINNEITIRASLDSITSTNIPLTTMEVSRQYDVLLAAYKSFARASQLNLADYL